MKNPPPTVFDEKYYLKEIPEEVAFERRIIRLPVGCTWKPVVDESYEYYAELLNATTIKFPYKLTIR